MRIAVLCLLLIVTLLSIIDLNNSFARRDGLTPDQKRRLHIAHTIRVETLALTEKGATDSRVIRRVVSDRLQAIGLTVVDTPSYPHDIVLTVKCEERRSVVAMTNIGGDADQLNAPSRLWEGPACQLTYSIDGQKGPWRKEVRTTFEDAGQAAQTTSNNNAGRYALDQLAIVLQKNDFPLELLAEWKQAKRLALILTSEESSPATKRTILLLAKKVPGPTMFEALYTLSKRDPVPETIRALGFMGQAATSFLVDLLEHSESVDVKASAAAALGEIGAHSGNLGILSSLLAMMNSPTIGLHVQTEIVKAIGKIPDHQSIDPLKKLGVHAWTSRSTDPQMQELREAIDWSLWQINPSAHTDD